MKLEEALYERCNATHDEEIPDILHLVGLGGEVDAQADAEALCQAPVAGFLNLR
jgi:hypothetical protein